MERERIEVPVKLIRAELDGMASILQHYYGTLVASHIPEALATQLVRDFQSWMLHQYRLTSEVQ